VAEARAKSGVSAFQVVGSALAAVTAAVFASHFGVGGTVTGAAVGSVIATTATAIYTNSLRRANEKLLTLRVLEGRVPRRSGPADPSVAEPADGATGVMGGSEVTASVPATTASTASTAAHRRWVMAATVLGVFLIAMATVTVVELAAGRPLSSLFGGGHDKGGTSVGGVLGGGGAPVTRPSPTPSPTPKPSPTTRPSPSPSPSPTATPSPTPTPSASPTKAPRPPTRRPQASSPR
jgi:hypothetical protein